jgi:hypothetical protein
VPLTGAHIEHYTSAVYILAGWIILGSAMLLFSVFIALFPRVLPRRGPSRGPSLPILDSSANTKQRLNEEQPLTKAMLSDFMPADPVSKQNENPHAPDASAKMAEGTVITDSTI